MHHRHLAVAAFCFSILFSASAMAQSVHGVLRVVKGDVRVKSGNDGQETKAKIGQKVFPKDTVSAGKDSRAKIIMLDNNEINVSPDTQLVIQAYEFKPEEGKKNVLLNVMYGKVRAKVNQKYDGESNKFQVKTPSAVAGVRGTDFLTSYDRGNKSSQVVTFEGRVEFGKPGPGGRIENPVSVNPGQMSTAAAGSPPAPPSEVPKSELAGMDKSTDAEKSPDSDKDAREPADSEKGSGKDKDGDKDKSKNDDAAKDDSKGKGKEDRNGDGNKSDEAREDNKTDRDTNKDKDKGNRSDNRNSDRGDSRGGGAGGGGMGGPKADVGMPGDSGRTPASVGEMPPPTMSPDGGLLPPMPGGSMLLPGDMASITTPEMPTMLPEFTPPPTAVYEPVVYTPPVCDTCNQIIEGPVKSLLLNVTICPAGGCVP